VGRAAERALLTARLDALRQGEGSVVLIEGEAGIGKSRLVETLANEARVRGVPLLLGAGDAIERTAPYHAWRAVVAGLLDSDGQPGDPAARRAAALTLLGGPNTALARLLPLLGAIVPLDLPETPLTRQMAGDVRADNTRLLLLRLLAARLGESPTLLILEDAHWLDSASWALAAAVAALPGLLLVLATRPLAPPVPPEWALLRDWPDTTEIPLGNLAPAEAVQLVCRRLGVAALPAPVADLIAEKAEGNPFFSEELAYALRDNGLIHIEGGVCRIAADAGDFESLALPDTLQGVIISRIDRLPPAQQLTLKVASAIGRVFAFRVLHDIHPILNARPHLRRDLLTLENLDLTPLDHPEPELSYLFKHIITQEVAYGLMLFAQRRQLHRAVAEWYEQQGEDPARLYPLLAHHWTRAEERDKALYYLDRAGEEALRNGAYREAIRFYEEALSLDEGSGAGGRGPDDATHNSQLHSLQHGRWHHRLAEAHLGLGRLAESRAQIGAALALLGRPLPPGTGPTARALATHLARHLARRGRLPAAQSADVLRTAKGDHEVVPKTHEARLREIVRAALLLSEITYFTGEQFVGIWAVLTALDQAEALGPAPELGRAYANMCIVAGIAGRHGRGRVYAAQAQTMAGESDLPSLVHVLGITAVYHIGVGDWDAARAALYRGQHLAELLGDRRHVVQARTTRAVLLHYQGAFAAAAARNADAYIMARQTGNTQHQGWGLYSGAENALRLGRFAEAHQLLVRVLPLLKGDTKRTAETRVYGTLALVLLRLGDPTTARRAAGHAAALLRRYGPNAYSGLEGYSGVAEVYLAAWEADGTHQAEARWAVGIMQRFARQFPVGGPRARLLAGQVAWLAGRPRAARRAWAAAGRLGRCLHMPYDVALAHLALGRHATGLTRRRHLTRAAALFTRLGAAHDAACAGELLRESTA
jgi:tetratricopeptide (TPR) repeat protein